MRAEIAADLLEKSWLPRLPRKGGGASSLEHDVRPECHENDSDQNRSRQLRTDRNPISACKPAPANRMATAVKGGRYHSK